MGINEADYKEKFDTLSNANKFTYIDVVRKNGRTYIVYKCNACKSIIESEQWKIFKSNKGYCRICSGRKEVARITDEVIRKDVERVGSKFLGRLPESLYKIKIKCKCGNYDIRSYERRKKMLCKACMSQKRKWPNQVDVNDVFDEIIRKGAIPLSKKSDYQNVTTPLKMQCKCGNIFTSSYSNIHKRGELLCRMCYMPSGGNHWNSKPDKLPSIRTTGRFKNGVRQSYRYQCCISGNDDMSELQVHHLNSRSKYGELTNDINNGVLIHKDLHVEFHSKYDKFTGNCNANMFYEFFREKTGNDFKNYIKENKLGVYYENKKY